MLPKSDTWKKETHIAWEPNWRKIYGYMNGGIETIPHEGFGWTIKNKDMKVRVCHMFEKIEFFSQENEGGTLEKIMDQIATIVTGTGGTMRSQGCVYSIFATLN